MNKYKKLSIIFIIMAIILSNIMSANVAFEYCNYLYQIEYGGFSAPANIAFLIAIPYMGVILILIFTTYYLWRKSEK